MQFLLIINAIVKLARTLLALFRVQQHKRVPMPVRSRISPERPFRGGLRSPGDDRP